MRITAFGFRVLRMLVKQSQAVNHVYRMYEKVV